MFFIGDVSVWGKFLTMIQGLFILIKGWNEQGLVTNYMKQLQLYHNKVKVTFFFPTWLAEPTQDRVKEELGQYFPCNYLTLQWKIANLYIWTLHGSWKGPIKQALSDLWSIVLSVWAFSWNWIISFFSSKFWHGCRNPSEVMHDRAGFFEGKKLLPKMGDK